MSTYHGEAAAEEDETHINQLIRLFAFHLELNVSTLIQSLDVLRIFSLPSIQCPTASDASPEDGVEERVEEILPLSYIHPSSSETRWRRRSTSRENYIHNLSKVLKTLTLFLFAG